MWGGMKMSKLSDSIQKKLNKEVSKSIICREWHSSIVLEGNVDTWEKVYLAGKLAVNKNYKGVVNKIEVEGLVIPEIKKPLLKDDYLHNKNVDVLIIGGGVIGSSIARELSKWNASVLLVDKEDDLAMHASSRNDGMIHPGLAPKSSSKKAYYNVKGNEMYTKITKELGVPFKRTGSRIVFYNKAIKLATPIFKARARHNGVKGVKYLNAEELRKVEPNISKDITGAIVMPTAGILSPYKMTIAFAENAVMNGVEVSLNTIVQSMEKKDGKILSVSTNRGIIRPKVVINAAGVYSDKIAAMVDDQFFTIHPRKGEIVLVDKKKGHLLYSIVSNPTLTTSKSTSKGGGVIKTSEGNILMGPNSYEQPFKEDFTTKKENIDEILKKHMNIISGLSHADIITYFAGVRAATYEEDFIVEKSEYVKNLVHAAGIQSPGLASAPAIAEDIEKMTIEILSKVKDVKRKDNWNPIRKGIPELSSMKDKERSALIKKRPDYGEIICRCEEVSKGEIIDAINAPIPAKSIDAIKRRTRAGMGRCQSGFCMPLVAKILEEESGLDMKTITKKGNASKILEGKTRKGQNEGGGNYEAL